VTKRIILPPKAFTDGVDGLIADQRTNLNQFTSKAHDDEIEAAYTRWPTATAMARSAIIKVEV